MWPKTKTPRQFAAKDWIATIVAVFALCISALNAYYTFFRRVDDLSALITSFPSVLVKDSRRLSISGKANVTFINSGTQSVSVLDLQIAINQKRSGPAQECVNLETRLFRTDIQPFVVKPNEMIQRRFGIKYLSESDLSKSGGSILFPVRKEVLQDNSGLIVNVCFIFAIVPQSGLTKHIDVDLGDYAIDKRQLYMEVDRYIDIEQAIKLIHIESSAIFSIATPPAKDAPETESPASPTLNHSNKSRDAAWDDYSNWLAPP
jgi:hypothetical protein